MSGGELVRLTLFYSYQLYSRHQQMLYSEDEVEEYFDYNSIMTLSGRRVRRLRRTEVSSQRLLLMKSKSPQHPGRSTNKQRQLRENKSSDISPSLAHIRSKLTIKCSSYLQHGFFRSKNEMHAEYSGEGCQQSISIQQSVTRTQQVQQSVKHRMGEYYFGGNAFDNNTHKSKKRSLSRSQSQNKPHSNKIESCQQIGYHRNMKSDYLMNLPNIPKHKPNKKIQPTNQYPKQEESQPSELSQASNLKSQSKMSLKEKVTKNSKSKIKISNSNSRISQVSSSQRESQISQQQISLKQPSAISNHSDYSQLYGLQQSQLSHKASRMQKLESKLSNNTVEKQPQSLVSRSKVSKVSKGSAASKLRSKLRSRLQQSQLSRQSNHSKLSSRQGGVGTSGIRQAIFEDNKMALTKKSTNAEQSQKTGENFNTPKMNKRETFGCSEGRLVKQETNNTKSTEQSSRQSIRMSANTNSNPEVGLSTPLAKRQSLQEYSLDQVVKNIEEHDIRLGFMYLFVDNTHQIYPTPITFQRYERLCFLMLKKYLFEKKHLISTLQGDAHCLVLTDVEVPPPSLRLFLGSLKDKLNSLEQEAIEISKEVQDQYMKIHKKYRKDKLMKLQSQQDNFSKEIMKLLMEQLTKLYQELQGEDEDRLEAESNQQRIIEIIQIMFLISELNGRPVKRFELLSENMVNFNEYYSENYEKIMETAEYFENLRDY